MSGNNQKINFIEISEESVKAKQNVKSKEYLCRSFIAILMDSTVKREQISHLNNCIKGFVYKKNEEKQGSITGILLHQKNVFLLFLECSFDSQMDLFKNQLLQLKNHSESGIQHLKLLVFNELYMFR
jgi:hypothetical protein